MKSSKMVKKAIELDMPDMEAVRKKCFEELHKGKGKTEKTNKRKANRKTRKSVYAGLGISAVIWLCALHLPASSDAESLIARLQTWLHLDHKRVVVGEMEKNSICIPEDCEEVEYGGEKYLTKSYASVEELEEDIGKHLNVWRGVDEYRKDSILLSIVERKYARVFIDYDLSKLKEGEFAGHENEMQDLEFYITIPLSEDFSMNSIALKDEILKDVVLNGQGKLISYGRNGDYSILETYHSEHLDIDVSMIEKQKLENVDRQQDADTSYYYLYFVHQGLNYQINCNSNLETAKSVIEKLE